MKGIHPIHSWSIGLLVCAGLVSFLSPAKMWGQEGALSGVGLIQSQVMEIVVGKSVLIPTKVPITRTSIANPAVADTVVLSPQQIYLVGKTIGTTNLTLWDEKGQVSTIDLEIVPDLYRLKEQLKHLLPEEQEIRIESSHDFVTLSGKVSTPETLKEVLTIAEAYAPKKIINLLRVIKIGLEDSHPIIIEEIRGTTMTQRDLSGGGSLTQPSQDN